MRQVAISLNLIWVLTWLKFLPRSRRESAKLFWVFAEPAGQLAIMIVLFTFIGRAPAYGTSMALFLLTGIVMLNFYTAGSTMVMQSLRTVANKTRLPQIGVFHDAVSNVIFKTVTAIGYTSILMIGIAIVLDVNVVPEHPFVVASAFFWCGMLCFGIGLLRAVAVQFMPMIERIYSTLARALFFISGIFYVPSFMPPQIRDMLAYNPVLQVVELFRLGVYDQYPTIVFSMLYLQCIALGSTTLGMALIWRNRAAFMD